MSDLMNLGDLSEALTYDPQTQIWRSERVGRVAYPEGDHATCFGLEETSFWFRHRNRCILAAVRRYPPPGFILDVGGGNGYVARGLIDGGVSCVLLEPGLGGARNARRARGIADVICATLDDAAFRPGSIPAVGMFDVLEHIEDDRAVVRQLHRVLQPGGLWYLTVPAYRWLWCASDVAAMHYRRYSPASLAEVVGEHFDIVYLTALFGRLVPPFLLTKALPYAIGLHRSQSPRQFDAEHRAGGATMSALVERALAHEVRLVERGRSQRWGSTLLMVARRR